MKKFASLTLKCTVSGVLIYLSLRGLDWTLLQDLLIHAQAMWLFASFVLLTASYAAGAAQWHLILSVADIEIPFLKTLGLYYVGLFFNNFLIGGMGGDLFRVYDLHKHQGGTGLSPSLASVFVDRFTGLLALLFIACVVGTFVSREEGSLYVVMLFVMASWILLIALLLYKPLADRLVKPIAMRLPEKLYARFQRLYYSVHNFRLHPRRLLYAFLIALLVQGMRITSIWCVGRALGDESAFLYYLLFVPVISIAASLPISIGGTGPREQTSILLFRHIGVGRELAFSIGFFTYGLSLLTTLPGAFVFVLRKTRKTYVETAAV